MKPDLLHVIEAAYAPQRSAADWLNAVANAAAPLLDQGQGVFGSWFDVDASGQVGLLQPVLLGCDQTMWSLVMGAAARLTSDEQVANLRQPAVLANTSERLGPRGAFKRHWLYADFQRAGITDFSFLASVDRDGRGFVLGAPCVVTAAPTPRVRRNWALVAAHLRAAARLVGGGETPANPAEPEAILRPDGRLLHAVGEARSKSDQAALRAAAKAVDRARSSLRRSDPDEALAVWRGLVAGKWSLVDEFDADGRRLLVAKRNEVRPEPVAALTLLEQRVAGYAALGHANKFIAYELGVSQASVSGALSGAMLKLGVRSRLALGAWLKAQGLGGAPASISSPAAQ